MIFLVNIRSFLFRYCLLFIIVLLANNSYCQWQSINSGLNENLVDGCFISDSVGFILGSNGTILKTVDTGNTWLVNSNLNGYFTSISKVDQDTIYVGGEKLYRSNDGGNSWSLVKIFNDTISDLRFFDSKIGLMIVPDLDSCYRGYYTITPNYKIYKTNDHGISWQYQFNQAIGSSRFTYINDSSTIIPRTEYTIFHGCAGPVFNNSLRTDDKGNSWYNVTGEAYGLYSYINDSVGYSFSRYYTNKFFFSRERGKSAISYATSYNGGLSRQIEFINEIDGYILGTNHIYSSRSKGINWSLEYTSSQDLRFLFKNQQGSFICLGDSGIILKKTHIPSTQADPVYRFNINKTALDFGLVNISSTSTQSIHLVNSGTRPLHLSFNSPEHFKISFSDSGFVDSSSFILKSLRDTLLYVQFNPTQSLTYNDTLLISVDSLTDRKITLKGIGFTGLSDTIVRDTLICVDTLDIVGDIVIPDSVKVIVCAGTHVNLMGSYDIEVNGVLQMLGDSMNMIKIRTFSSFIKWDGIQVNSSNTQDSSIFNYCNFYSSCSGPFISMNSGIIKIDHSFFRHRDPNYPIGSTAIESKGSAKMTISNSTIAYNNGDAIFCDDPDSTFIINNVIHDTEDGVGIRVNSAKDVFLIGNHLYNNEFEAIYASAPLVVRKNRINNNGGGIRIDAPDMKITIENNIIYNNRSPKLGGIYISYSAELLFRQNLIFNNEARSFDGGGLLLSFNDTTSKYIVNNTICNNKVRSSSRGNNIFFYTSNDSTIDLNVFNNIVYSSNEFDKSVKWYNIEGQNIAYNCINQPGIELLGATNINANPGIVNPTTMSSIGNYDWSLDSSSICIDAGHPLETSLLLPFDIAGNPRIADGRVDLGAFEYVAPTSIDEIKTESFIIYPNPVEDALHISLGQIGKCEVILYDAASKVVLKRTFIASIILDVSDLKRGIYFYKIQSEKKLIGQGKVVKY